MAMQASRPVTSTIWVGNLPFETTEADLQQLLATVGPIKNLRLIIDRESGRPKGFGFCEYFDKATAESAHRNLNGSEFHGRNIRIDFAEEFSQKRERDDRPGPPVERPERAGGGRMIGYAAASQSAQQVQSMLGGAPSSDRRVQDQLNELLASKSKPELWEVLRLLKEFLGGDPAAAKAYFAERPGLTKAVFQAQVLLGMVKAPPAAAAAAAAAGAPPGYGQPPANFQEGPIGLGGRMPGAAAPPPPPPRGAGAGGPMGLQPPPMMQQQGPGMPVVMVDPASGQPQTVLMPQQQLGGMGVPMQPPQGMLPQQPMPMQQQPMPMPMQQMPGQEPGMQGVPMQQPGQPQQPGQMGMPPVPMQGQPPQQPASGGAGALGGDSAQMQQLLRQVVGMTDEQINALPEQFKQQVLFVKEQIRLGNVKVE